MAKSLKKEGDSRGVSNLSSSHGMRAGSIFLPISRPYLKSIPNPAQALAFLKAFDLYCEEVRHRRNEGEGDHEQDPMHFCFHPDLLEFCVEADGLEKDETSKLVPDEQLRGWLNEIAEIEDHRPLAEVMRGLVWPSAKGGRSLLQQTKLFQMAVVILLRDSRGAGNYFDKDIIKILCPLLPSSLKLSVLEHFQLKRGAETKKSLVKFWRWLREQAAGQDNYARFFHNPAIATQSPKPKGDTGGNNGGGGDKPPPPKKSGGSKDKYKGKDTTSGAGESKSSGATEPVRRPCLGCDSVEHGFKLCPKYPEPRDRAKRYEEVMAARRAAKESSAGTTRSGKRYQPDSPPNKIDRIGEPEKGKPYMLAKMGTTTIKCNDDSGADRTILFSALVDKLTGAGIKMELTPDDSKSFELADKSVLRATHRVNITLGLPSSTTHARVWMRNICAYVVPGESDVCLLGHPELSALGVPTAQHVVDKLLDAGVSEIDAAPSPARMQRQLQLLRVRTLTASSDNSDDNASDAAPDSENHTDDDAVSDADLPGLVQSDSDDSDTEDEAMDTLDEEAGPTSDEHDTAATAAAVEDMFARAAAAGATPDIIAQMHQTIDAFADVWRSQLGADPPARVQPMKIRLVDEAELPRRPAARRFSPLQQDFLHDHVAMLLRTGVATRSCSEVTSPIVLVRKPDKSWRLCVDLRRVNSITKQEHWPLPRLEEMLTHLTGAAFFATFDLLKGFWQFPIAGDSQKYMSFTTHEGQFEFTRVVMGAKNSSSHFQQVMTTLLGEYIGSSMLVFLDDVLVYSKTVDGLLESIGNLLRVFNEVGVKLKPQKCELYAKQLTWCGRTISEAGVGIATEYQQTLLGIPEPNNAAELQQFLAATNWIRGMIPQYSRITLPLQNVLNAALAKTKRRSKQQAAKLPLSQHGWTTEHSDAYATLKQAVAACVTNAHPDEDKEFCLFTDASEDSWGAVLTQVPAAEYADPNLSWDQYSHEPLAFLSGVFRGSELRWAIPDKEAYAIYNSCKRLAYLLVRRRGFHVYTDHRNLVYIFNPAGSNTHLGKPAADRLERWSLTLRAFDFDIEHMPGEDNNWADLLSRWGNPEVHARVCSRERLHAAVLRVRPDRVLLEPAHDHRQAIGDDEQAAAPDEQWPTLEEIRAEQKTRPPLPVYAVRYDKDCNVYRHATGGICVPDGAHRLRARILVISHCGAVGHFAQAETLLRLSNHFWWPSLKEQAIAFLATCLLCHKTRAGDVQPRPFGHQLNGKTVGECIHMDFLSMTELKGIEHGLLVLKDSLATWCWLHPCSSFCARNVEAAVLAWASIFGMPSMIVTDSGTHFKNELIKALTLRMRCMHHCTTPYAHWAHGVSERMNRTILKVYRVLLAESSTDYREWVPVTPLVMSSINTHTSMQRLDGLNASQVFLGRTVPTPLSTVAGDFLRAANIPEIPQSQAARAAYAEAAEAIQTNWLHVTNARERRAAQNRAAREKISTPEDFKIGDYVLCRVPADVRRNKLRVKWLGPYKVVDTINERVFVIQDICTQRRSSVHGQRLRYYADSALQLTEDLRMQAAYDDQHWVSDFIDWRISDEDELELRIRWQGFEANEDTWEDPVRLHDDVPAMLLTYLRTIRPECPAHVTPLLRKYDKLFVEDQDEDAAKPKKRSGRRGRPRRPPRK